MTLADWLTESRQRFSDLPFPVAARRSAWEFWRGVSRRILDPLVGRSVWDRGDWDVLIVLDAARPDMTRTALGERDYESLPNPDAVSTVWSNASCSIDWIERTFNQHPNAAATTGYVTANPFTAHEISDVRSADLSEERVGHLRELYETNWQSVAGGIETVPPERVTDHAIDTWRHREALGIDRLVVHYMQPHEPFRARPEWGEGEHALLEDLVDGDEQKAGASIYPAVRDGEVPLSEFRDVYLDNHHWVLEELNDRLLPNLDARVTITADHANALGEWGGWHHPPGAVNPAMRRVPWLEAECRDHRTVAPATDRNGRTAADEQQLEALGYV